MLWLVLLMMQIVIGPNYSISWDQYAANDIEIKELSFNAYFDRTDTPVKLYGVSCKGFAPGYVCSVPLMKLNPGLHSVSLQSINAYGISGKSQEYRFLVLFNRRGQLEAIPQPVKE